MTGRGRGGSNAADIGAQEFLLNFGRALLLKQESDPQTLTQSHQCDTIVREYQPLGKARAWLILVK